MEVLGIEVPEERRRRWIEWLAPDPQPFFVESRRDWPASTDSSLLTPEVGDTCRSWRLRRDLDVIWLGEATFLELSRPERRRLVREQVRHGRGAVPSVRRWSDLLDSALLRSHADGHRFVWWPSLLARGSGAVLARVIASSPDGAQPAAAASRHREVAGESWAACAGVVPGARTLAGTFASSSGPNCFGTVMAAAGVEGMEDAGVGVEPFECWLAEAGQPSPRGGGIDPGTVLVWRDADAQPVHAAVTIGDGWALEKGSSEWWTPRAIRRIDEVVRAARAPGQRLERHRL